ncbi:MAG: RNA polymerase sigma factor, partial [Actinomycetes bacterium]
SAAGRSEALRTALADLPPRTRAAVVLRLYAELPEEETARLLRTDRESVLAELTRGRARLEQSLALTAGAGVSPGPVPSAGDLAEELRRLVEGVARPPFDPVAAAAALSREAVGRRRRRLTGIAGALAAAVVTVVAVRPDDRPATPDVPAVVPAEAIAVHDLPTRGSLAGDTAFLDGVRALPWESEIFGVDGAPAYAMPSFRRVVFAGDVPGGRWALVVGSSSSGDPRGGPDGSGDLLQAWFTGPPGAAPEQMALSSYPLGVPPDVPVALLDPRTGTLVVVAAPGDAVEVSERSVLAADGSRSRPYQPADTTEGIATTRIGLGGTTLPFAVHYRVLRGGTVVASSSPEWVVSSVGPDLPVVDISYPRGIPAADAASAAQSAALAVLVPLGLPVRGTDVVARWAGPLPEPADGALAVVTVTAPSGAVVTTAHWQAVSGTGDVTSGGECGLDIRPAGEPTEQRVLAVGCEVYSATTGAVVDEVLVVLVPPSVTALRAYDMRGRFLADLPVPEDGVLLGAKPPGTAEVEAETAGGILLGRTDLLGREELWD